MVLRGIVVIIVALAALMGADCGMGMMGGGMSAAFIMLVGGGLYIGFVAGVMYLGLGIYHDTRRTADATEKMAAQIGV